MKFATVVRILCIALLSLAVPGRSHGSPKCVTGSEHRADRSTDDSTAKVTHNLPLGNGITVVAQTSPFPTTGVYHLNASVSLLVSDADVGAFCFLTTTNHGFAQDALLSESQNVGRLRHAALSESWSVTAGDAVQLACYSGDSETALHRFSLTATAAGPAHRATGSHVAYLNRGKVVKPSPHGQLGFQSNGRSDR